MSYIKKLFLKILNLIWVFPKRIVRKKPKITLSPNIAHIYTDTIKLNKRTKNLTTKQTKWLFRYKE